MERTTYIDNIDVQKAKALYFEKLNIHPQAEEVDLSDALGRVTFEPVFAKVSSPNYNAAAMDGIAVRAVDTGEATEVRPVSLEEGRDFIYVNTGNQIKEPWDAVIMIEDVIHTEEGRVQILSSAYPWQHIRQIGEDIVATEMILPSKHRIRPMDLGALIAGGTQKVLVYKKPKVGILPTGTEIVEDISQVTDGKIIDSNSRVFSAMTLENGGEPTRYSPCKDDFELLKRAILKGVEENDIMLINAGSSAGTTDYTVKLIRELGEVIIHGVAMKPGKPTILGLINGKPVIGIPGYPVSAYLVFDEFVKPLIKKFQGQEKDDARYVKASLSRRVVSSLKHKDLVRVNLGYVNEKLLATPLPGGAGTSMSLVRADGIAIIPQSAEGAEAGDMVDVKLLKPESEIMDTLVSIGSHDLIMDILGDIMPLSSSHVGSLGGIMALMRGECHMAPTHLLDMDTGEYNISYVKKYFPNEKMLLIKGVHRKQGFIVEKGNPKHIKAFSDLTREGVTYANRQRGAGTRILLDYHLNKENIDPEEIIGYKRELNTHMAVATAVKTGSATAGLGIYSAAQAMELDFVEVTNEDYDFLVKEKDIKDPRILAFMDALKSDAFRKKVEALGGYGFERTGEVIEIG